MVDGDPIDRGERLDEEVGGTEHDLGKAALESDRTEAQVIGGGEHDPLAELAEDESGEHGSDSGKGIDPEVEQALAADETLMSFRDWRAHLLQQDLPGKEKLIEILEGKIQERTDEISRQIEDERARKQEFLEKTAARILGQVTEKIAGFIKSEYSSIEILTGKHLASEEFGLQVANEAIDEAKLTASEVQEIVMLIYKLLGAEVANEDETEYILDKTHNAMEHDYTATIHRATLIHGVKLVETKKKKVIAQDPTAENIKQARLGHTTLLLERTEQ